MNWKKAGYKPGDKVYIVQSMLFSERKSFLDGTVTYVGTKILKVSLDDIDTKLEFTKRYISGKMIGYCYEVYKSKEEYDEILRKELDRKTLIGLIEHSIKNLSNEQLEEVEKLISSFNKSNK